MCAALVLVCGVRALAQNTSVIREIVINGNLNVSKEAILAALRTKVGQPYVQAQLDQDKRTIEDMGYFKAVEVRAKPLESDNYQIVIDLAEFGKIKEIRVVGNSAVKTEVIMKSMTMAPGDVFNIKQINPSVKAIEKYYADKGFFAKVDTLGLLEDSPGTVSVSIIELKVNSVGWQGNDRTKDVIMRRLIKSRPGDNYSSKRWENDLRRLYGTQWFETVTSDETMSDEIGKVDLVAKVREARTGMFNLGGVLDPRSGLAGTLRVADTNFKGTGQNVGIDFLQSTRGDGPSIALEYGNPFTDSRDTAFNASLYSRINYRFLGDSLGSSSSLNGTDTYTERRTGGAFSISRPLGDDRAVSVGLKLESIVTKGLDPTIATSYIQQDGQIAIASFGFVRNRRDVDLDPSRGYWTQFLSEPGYSNITSTGGLISDPSIVGSNYFLRNTIEFRTYHSDQPPRGRQLDAPRRVLAFKLKVGSIQGKVPFFEQFFVGGSSSLRGYQEDEFWGKQMIQSTLEYRYPLQKSFNAILFADYGGAWGGYGTVQNFDQSDKLKLHLGYGVGFSFRTPLGPIRLDFGFNEQGRSRTHFIIGYSF